MSGRITDKFQFMQSSFMWMNYGRLKMKTYFLFVQEQLNNHVPNHYLPGIAHKFNALTDQTSSSNVKSGKSSFTCNRLSILKDPKFKTHGK